MGELHARLGEGTLTITLIADPNGVPNLDEVVVDLRDVAEIAACDAEPVL
ncbi:hypothetical protein ACFLIM_19800 [Nonomuraea sp. M3C6]|uniref:Uncharacterized protein n=1 Tax=Nonomuraea marmarensis TaxID=3351344 RepID=A0ABW7ADL6_9ACTN